MTIANAHVCTQPEVRKHSCMSENVLPLEFIQSLKLNGPIVSSAKEASCIIDILKVCLAKLFTCSVGLFSLNTCTHACTVCSLYSINSFIVNINFMCICYMAMYHAHCSAIYARTHIYMRCVYTIISTQYWKW